MLRAPLMLIVVHALLLGACDRAADAIRIGQGTAAVGGTVVSTVDGTPITLAAVQRVVDATGWAPAVALEKLQAQRLLAREAERRGYGGQWGESPARSQALVQALLAQEVETLEPSDVGVAELYEERKAKYAAGEKRGSVHVLAQFKEGAPPGLVRVARAFAVEALRRFQLADDPQEVLTWAEQEAGKMDLPFNVRPEKLPRVPRNGRFVKAYSDALFEPESTGPLPRVVRTSFGFHAIYVTEILEAKEVPLAQARPELLPVVARRERSARVRGWVERMRVAERIELHKAGLAAIGELRL